ncbi:hypothetical protein V500_03543, partial [Pseudogymnoascus sp. VKM F-4518 (FW-2643)]
TSTLEQPPFLAYLSACNTSQVENERMIDEGLHLVNAFQLAGFQHVIGTLWDVDDKLCGDVARIVYKHVLGAEITHESVCLGLHTAIKWCRDQWRVGVLRETGESTYAADPAIISGRDYGQQSARHTRGFEWVPYIHFGGRVVEGWEADVCYTDGEELDDIKSWSGMGPSHPTREPSLPLPEAGIDSDTFDFSPLPELEELQYQGFYDLSFEKLPDIPRNGRVASIGRWNSDSSAFTRTGVVDLMLAPSDGKKLYGVRGKHAIFYFDSSGCLCVKSPPLGTSIFLGTEEFSSGSRVVSSRSQIVSFGNLTYCLEYVNADEVTYQSNLNAYFTSYLSSPAPPPDISATPSLWDFTLDDWVWKGTAGSGGFGTVSAAKNRVTGEPAAAKTIMRTSKTMRDIAGEFSILEHLPSHSQLLVKRGVYYERGDT